MVGQGVCCNMPDALDATLQHVACHLPDALDATLQPVACHLPDALDATLQPVACHLPDALDATLQHVSFVRTYIAKVSYLYRWKQITGQSQYISPWAENVFRSVMSKWNLRVKRVNADTRRMARSALTRNGQP